VNELVRLVAEPSTLRKNIVTEESSGTIKPLGHAKCLKRQERPSKEFGGPCDVSTWDHVNEAEKQQLRQPP